MYYERKLKLINKQFFEIEYNTYLWLVYCDLANDLAINEER